MKNKFLLTLLPKKDMAIGTFLTLDEFILGRVGVASVLFLVWARHFIGSSKFGIFD